MKNNTYNNILVLFIIFSMNLFIRLFPLASINTLCILYLSIISNLINMILFIISNDKESLYFFFINNCIMKINNNQRKKIKLIINKVTNLKYSKLPIMMLLLHMK